MRPTFVSQNGIARAVHRPGQRAASSLRISFGKSSKFEYMNKLIFDLRKIIEDLLRT